MEHKICVLIIDSDPKSIIQMQEILNENTLVDRVEIASNSEMALLKVIDDIPNAVFFEFPFKDKTSSDLYKFIKTRLTDTTIVFTSNSKENAALAIQNGIYHYLLKPIIKDKLNKIIEQVLLIKQNSIQLKLKQVIEKSTEEKRMMFNTSKGYVMIDPEEIIFCKADGISSEMYLSGNRTVNIYLFLSKIEEMLSAEDFIRSNRKFLINKKYIRKVFKHNNSIQLFHDGKEYIVKGSKQHIKNLTKLNTD